MSTIHTVLPNSTPQDMLDKWTEHFTKEGCTQFDEIIDSLLSDSHNLQHPRYIGHQCGVPLPISILSEFPAAFTNNGSAVFEMGPVNVAMKKRLVQWMI